MKFSGQVNLRLSKPLIDSIDKARGSQPRQPWIIEAIQAKLKQARKETP